MIRCYITDRQSLGGVEALLANARRVAGHVDWIQLREKDLPHDELLAIARELVKLPVKLIVNSNVDVARACGAAGVHLPASIPIPANLPGDLLIGVSCHSVAEVRRTVRAGYALLSPIFSSPSKPGYGPALGLAQLAEAARSAPIPVLALGGVNESNAPACVAAGAAGYASISAFQPATQS
jgi:thiamine-phosphate diphosphorylase